MNKLSVDETITNGTKQKAIGHCLICERNVFNPCKARGLIPGENLTLTPELIVREGIVIRVKTAEQLLQKGAFCDMGRWLADKKLIDPEQHPEAAAQLKSPEIRNMTATVVFGGIEKGMRYEWPDGREYIIEPETVDSIFDGRKTVYLPADVPSWADEPQAYDRSIRDWKKRAVAGEIKGKPDSRWTERLRLLDLTRRVLNSIPFNDG